MNLEEQYRVVPWWWVAYVLYLVRKTLTEISLCRSYAAIVDRMSRELRDF